MEIVPELIDLDPADLVVIRDEVPLAELPAFYDASFSRLPDAIAAAGRRITGPARGITYAMPGETVEIGAAFPIDGDFPAADGVTGERSPGGRAARYTHRGSYDLLPQVYAAVFDWIDRQGLHPGALCWENYVTEPTPEMDPADLITEVVVPLREG